MGKDPLVKELRIVCTNAPSPYAGKLGCEFLETEDENGRSVNAGEWRERRDGLWELVVIVDTLR